MKTNDTNKFSNNVKTHISIYCTSLNSSIVKYAYAVRYC